MSQQLHRIDLAEFGIPREATAVMYGWTMKPESAKTFLYRTQDDSEPVLLTGTPKINRIGLVERQTLYFKTECDSTQYVIFSLQVLGHEEIAGL